MPARPQAWISVMPFGTSCSLLSMMSLGTLLCLLVWRVDPGELRRRRNLVGVGQRILQEHLECRRVLFEIARILEVLRQEIVAVRIQLEADGNVPFLGRRYVQDRLARIEDRVDIELVFLKCLDAAVDGAGLVV